MGSVIVLDVDLLNLQRGGIFDSAYEISDERRPKSTSVGLIMDEEKRFEEKKATSFVKPEYLSIQKNSFLRKID